MPKYLPLLVFFQEFINSSPSGKGLIWAIFEIHRQLGVNTERKSRHHGEEGAQIIVVAKKIVT